MTGMIGEAMVKRYRKMRIRYLYGGDISIIREREFIMAGEEVRAFLASLGDPVEREICREYILEGRTLDEIAWKRNCSLKTVWYYKDKAFRRLRDGGETERKSSL